MKELNTSKIEHYLQKGKDHKYWYETESQKLLELLPEFKDLPILKCFAITSMTTSIEANVHLALKALMQMQRGEIFHGFLPAQRMYLEMIYFQKDVPGRKIGNFIKALEGDKNSVVVDIWMCRAFDMLNARKLPNGRDYFKSPSKAEYNEIESWVKNACEISYHIEPRQFQSMVWAGVKREFGMTRNVTWSDLLIKKRGMFSYETEKVQYTGM